ncbi:unnamed protein product [Moneuplotes crassus]|uniref:EF-hand domain-containing protein n=1 Tax=Euplotes crassus TaxID=5936 RepID=A0AAD1Y5Q2_EUPCR|nr:unnamed protein product [Moneuplotes crassus]
MKKAKRTSSASGSDQMKNILKQLFYKIAEYKRYCRRSGAGFGTPFKETQNLTPAHSRHTGTSSGASLSKSGYHSHWFKGSEIQREEKVILEDEIEELKLRLERCDEMTFLKAFQLIDTLNINFIDFTSIERFMKEDWGFKKRHIRAVISYLDQTGNEKVTFNEFIISLTPTTRAPRVEDIPEIISYSPRKAALEDSLPPKFNESYTTKKKSLKLKSKTRSSKVFPLRNNKTHRIFHTNLNTSKNSRTKSKSKLSSKCSKCSNTTWLKMSKIIKKNTIKAKPKTSHSKLKKKAKPLKPKDKTLILRRLKEKEQTNLAKVQERRRQCQAKLEEQNETVRKKIFRGSECEEEIGEQRRMRGRGREGLKEDERIGNREEKDVERLDISPLRHKSFDRVKTTKNVTFQDQSPEYNLPKQMLSGKKIDRPPLPNSSKNIRMEDRIRNSQELRHKASYKPASYIKPFSKLRSEVSPAYHTSAHYSRRISPLRPAPSHLPDRPLINSNTYSGKNSHRESYSTHKASDRSFKIQHEESKASPKHNKDLVTILNVLKDQISFENNIERARIRLAYTSDFNLMDAFRIFDIDGQGTIQPSDLLKGLENLGIISNANLPTILDKDSVFLFMMRYDNDHDGRMKYSDFCDAFTPKELKLSAEIHSRPPYNIYSEGDPSKYFSPETRALLRQAFRVHFESELKTEKIRQSLMLNVNEAFKLLDSDLDGYISKKELAQAFETNQIFLNQQDIDFIMDRYDQNKDSRISFKEFTDELTQRITIHY